MNNREQSEAGIREEWKIRGTEKRKSTFESILKWVQFRESWYNCESNGSEKFLMHYINFQNCQTCFSTVYFYYCRSVVVHRFAEQTDSSIKSFEYNTTYCTSNELLDWIALRCFYWLLNCFCKLVNGIDKYHTDIRLCLDVFRSRFYETEWIHRRIGNKERKILSLHNWFHKIRTKNNLQFTRTARLYYKEGIIWFAVDDWIFFHQLLVKGSKL